MNVESTLKSVESGAPDDLAQAVQTLSVEGRSAVPELIEALNAAQPVVRWVAATVLGELGDREAAGALRRALEDDHVAVRTRAAYSLSQLGDTSGVPTLLAALDSDEVMIGHPPELVSDFAGDALRAIAGLTDPAESGRRPKEFWEDWWAKERSASS
jgi:HEAT repeat protein